MTRKTIVRSSKSVGIVNNTLVMTYERRPIAYTLPYSLLIILSKNRKKGEIRAF